ncbi:MAG: hypothetical protein WCI12_08050 [Actinomycetes bacterium]
MSSAMTKVALAASIAGFSVVAAACGTSSEPSTSTTAPSTTKATTTSTTTATTTPPIGGQVTRVDPTASDEAALVAAGAAHNNLAPSDYTGVASGSVYLATDGSTGYRWAGASLVPSSSSEQAQIDSQDEGSYLIFSEAPGQSWNVVATTGLMATCPPGVPPTDVVAAWGWAPGTCNPHR